MIVFDKISRNLDIASHFVVGQKEATKKSEMILLINNIYLAKSDNLACSNLEIFIVRFPIEWIKEIFDDRKLELFLGAQGTVHA